MSIHWRWAMMMSAKDVLYYTNKPSGGHGLKASGVTISTVGEPSSVPFLRLLRNG